MLSEVSQAQKDKGRMFSLIHGRQIQKISIYTKIMLHFVYATFPLSFYLLMFNILAIVISATINLDE
jgi:hypothetical protein